MLTCSPFRALIPALFAAAVITAPLAAVPAHAQSPDDLPPGVTPLPDLPVPNPRAPGLLEPPAELPSARPPVPEPGADEQAAREPDAKVEPTLDALFTELADARDDRTAGQVALRIQRRLAASGSATVDVLMGQAQTAIGADNMPLALDLLDAVTRLQPAYAEGWSRRAAVHYQRDDYGKAIADLEHALALEPRDWRTLVGLGVVLRALDREEAALKAYEAALAVHPRNADARKAHDDLAAKVRGLEL
jgi:hypothetical protein